MKVMFVRAPRYLWPIINESDNFLMPLNYPCLASSIRKELPDVEVKIIDCLPHRIGWKSLAGILAEEKPDFLGVGDEAVYQHEGIKALKLMKEISPETKTVAGGHFHSHVPRESLMKYPYLDYIVRHEGERTIVELIDTVRSGGNLEKVDGIAYRDNGDVRITRPRKLAKHLDDYPMPAYDLMPIDHYAPFGKLWPRSATVEGSRGCIDSCKFCSLWGIMGDRSVKEDDEEVVRPRYRQKSIDRMMDEIDILYNKYDRRYLFWVDATFNVNPKWTGELCDRIDAQGMKFVGWWAFVRVDFLLRDEKLGVLEKMVNAGLSHVLIGIERAKTDDIKKLGKKNYTDDKTLECYEIFKKKYPKVFRQGTMIVGVPDETRESMMDMVKYAIRLGVDYPAFHTLAPVPGTVLYDELKEQGLIEVEDFSEYDWYTPIIRTRHMSRAEVANTLKDMQKRFVVYRPHWYMKGLFSPNALRRNIYIWFFYVVLKMMFFDILDTVFRRREFSGVTGLMKLRKPRWYDS